VEVVVAIIKAAAVMPVGNPERAVDCADGGSNRATDDSADRARGTIALARALLFAPDQALRMSEMRHREQCQNDGCAGQTELCGRNSRHRQRPALRIHLNSWLLGCCWADGAGMCNADAAERLQGGDRFTTGGDNASEKQRSSPN
jgi:hypothetical protein